VLQNGRARHEQSPSQHLLTKAVNISIFFQKFQQIPTKQNTHCLLIMIAEADNKIKPVHAR
jgi:hypothetical protein